MNAPAARLAGQLLSGTSVVTLVTASLQTEITRIMVADVRATPVTTERVSVYHVPADATQGDEHLILRAAEGAAVEAASAGAGVTLLPGEVLAVEAPTADAFAVTVYGTTQEVGYDG